MSIVPMIKKCPRCQRKYQFNPDIGEGLFCPYCAGLGMPSKTTLQDILRKIKIKRKR